MINVYFETKETVEDDGAREQIARLKSVKRALCNRFIAYATLTLLCLSVVAVVLFDLQLQLFAFRFHNSKSVMTKIISDFEQTKKKQLIFQKLLDKFANKLGRFCCRFQYTMLYTFFLIIIKLRKKKQLITDSKFRKFDTKTSVAK